MLMLDDFQKLKLEDKPVFDELYSKHPPKHSEYVFTTLVSWLHYVEAMFLLSGDSILLTTKYDGKRQIRAPHGERNQKLLEEVISLAKTDEDVRALVAIDEETKSWISDIYPDMQFNPNRNYFDYVYLASDLAELPGKNYLKIRNRLNRFHKKYEFTIEPISDQNFEEMLLFLQRWCLWRDCESNTMLDNERIAVLYSMDNFFKLGLSGIAIRIGLNIEAISVFQKMNPETAIIHFEKAMPDFDGIYQAINNEAAKELAKDYKFINRESDLGIDGLREAKKRYHPHHMEKVFFVDRENLLKV